LECAAAEVEPCVINFPSPAAQIIHVMRKSNVPMDAHAIYTATAITDKQTLYNTLSNMFNKMVLERDRDNDSKPWLYWLHPRGKVPDRIAEELLELEKNGLPVVERHPGQSQDEYRSKEKRAVKHTRTLEVTAREEVCEVVVPDSWVRDGFVRPQEPEPVAVVHAPPPAPAITPPQESEHLGAQENLRLKLQCKAEEAQAKVDVMFLLQELAAGSSRLVELMEDYAEMLQMGGFGDEPDTLLIDRHTDALQFARAAKAFKPAMLDRLIDHLQNWRDVCVDCATDNALDENNIDAEDIAELVTMLGQLPRRSK